MGEVLHAIDFDQLQIENKQYLAKIEERNAELLKLKMTAGNTVQILNYYKVGDTYNILFKGKLILLNIRKNFTLSR